MLRSAYPHKCEHMQYTEVVSVNEGAQPVSQILPVLAQILPVFVCPTKLSPMLRYHVKTTGLQCTTRIIRRPTSLKGAFKQAMGTLTLLLMQLMPLDFTQLLQRCFMALGSAAATAPPPICSHLSSYYFHKHLCLFHFKFREAPLPRQAASSPSSRVPTPLLREKHHSRGAPACPPAAGLTCS